MPTIKKAIKPQKTETQITSQMLKELRQEINQALKEIADNYNINIDCGNCSYDDNEATYKLKINTKNDEGQLINKEKKKLKKKEEEKKNLRKLIGDKNKSINDHKKELEDLQNKLKGLD